MSREGFRAAMAVVSVMGCGGSASNSELAPTMTNVQVEIFDKSCGRFLGCHQGAAPAADLNLEAPARAKLQRASVQRPERLLVVPEDPEASFLMDKLLGRGLPVGIPGGSVRMPPSSPSIEAERLELVRAWIAAGALDN